MGKVEEYFDLIRLQDFLAGKRGSPFSQEDIRQAKDMGVDLTTKESEA